LNRTYNFPIQEQSFMLEDDIQPLEPEVSEEEDEWEIALDTSNQEQDSVAIATALVEEYTTETRPDVRAYSEQQTNV
jgi:predicted  nucleic acid-binding Zn-ribbon protein